MKIKLKVVVLILNAKSKNLNTIQAPVYKLYLATIQTLYQNEDSSACLDNQYCKTNLYFYNITFYINGFTLVTLVRESYSQGKKIGETYIHILQFQDIKVSWINLV